MADLGFSFVVSDSGQAIEARLLRHDMKHLRTKGAKYLLSTSVMTFDEAKRHHAELGRLLDAGPQLDEAPNLEDDFSDVL